MATLERAIAIAVQAHQGQRDKAGAPYILHPLRLMMRMQTEAEMIAAVLHDVIEDTEWTPDGLRAEGFSAGIIEAIECLTRPLMKRMTISSSASKPVLLRGASRLPTLKTT